MCLSFLSWQQQSRGSEREGWESTQTLEVLLTSETGARCEGSYISVVATRQEKRTENAGNVKGGQEFTRRRMNVLTLGTEIKTQLSPRTCKRVILSAKKKSNPPEPWNDRKG